MNDVSRIEEVTTDHVDDNNYSLGAEFHKGPLYREYVAEVVKKKCARNYMEVGVREGFCITNISVPSIGIDPFFQFACNPIAAKKVLFLFQMSSDEFFRDYDPRALFGHDVVDVTFLDGLHQFEFLLRDFINSERVSGKDSLILLDDCLPVNVEMTERRHIPDLRKDRNLAGWWTGDVWKIIPILKKYRPDLVTIPFDTPPTGNIMVTNLDPNSTVLRDNYHNIVREFSDLHLDHAGLVDLMSSNPPVSARAMLTNFDYSLYFKP